MVGVAGASVLAVLTRAPSAWGKSRLFTALGREPDPALLTALLLDTLEGAAVDGVVRVVAVEPAAACSEIRALVPSGILVIPQDRGSLGRRMRTLMASLLEAGASAVALIGSDLPDMTPGPVASAFACLARHPASVVIGPAEDGGYYLIAATRTPDVFDTVRWGSRHVLADTTAAAVRAGRPVHLLEPLADVDTLEDLRRLVGRHRPGVAHAARTVRWARDTGIAGLRSE